MKLKLIIYRYLSFDDAPYDFGYFFLEKNSYIEKITNSSKIKISSNDYIIDFNITDREKINFNDIIINYTLSIDNDETYTKQCQIKFNFPFALCYKSCDICSQDKYSTNNTNHNCEKCRENYYSSPIIKSNCYTLEEKEINWYFNKSNLSFGLCDEDCKSCSGPSKNECLSCYNNSYLYLGKCQNQCDSGYFGELINDNDNYYYNCSKCYENCETCNEKGNSTNMKCETCKDNYIKYENNCYEIKNSKIKSFYDPENDNIETSCYEKFKLYIKEDSNEYINYSEANEGYYISNNITGLISKCHENCLSCDNGIIKDISDNLISMECLLCKDSNDINKSMIRYKNNCFKIIQYNEMNITFNISQINPNEIGSC